MRLRLGERLSFTAPDGLRMVMTLTRLIHDKHLCRVWCVADGPDDFHAASSFVLTFVSYRFFQSYALSQNRDNYVQKDCHPGNCSTS